MEIMRWKRKTKKYRFVKRFAFFPIEIGNETRWLEFVYIHQVYEPYNPVYDWKNYRFITKEEYKKYKKEK